MKTRTKLSWFDYWMMQVRRTEGWTFVRIAREFKVSRGHARKICGWIGPV